MVQTTERVLEFARTAFEDYIANLLDDPSHLEQDYEYTGLTPKEAIALYRQIANDLGLDFDVLVAKGHPEEIEGLKAIENGF